MQHKDLCKTEKYSVLMSVYRKENPAFFFTAVESVINQTVPPDEVLIVQDGPLTADLISMCEKVQDLYPQIIHFLPLHENHGLGLALQYGTKACRNELIGRMDTDDISLPDRFEKQLKEFAAHPDLVLCGGYIREFDDNPSQIISTRKVPLSQNEIYEFGKRRNPFNHVTVMFRKSAVLAVGNYQPFLLMEDYYLWFRMIMHGDRMENIAEPLVLVRTGEGMIGRRGGLSYFKKEKSLYQEFRKAGYLSRQEYMTVLLIRFIARIIPSKLRELLYRRFLRR